MEAINFLDLKTGNQFSTRNYTTEVNSKGMLMAVAVAPSGTISKRMLRKI